MNFFSLYGRALKKIGLPLLTVFLFFTFFDQGLTKTLEADLRSPQGASSFVFLYAGLYLANSIFFMSLAFLLGIYGLTSKQQTLGSFLRHFFNQNCIEMLRSWGKVLSWSFLLILPGFIKYLQFLLVPFVVTLFPSYEQGQADALKTSRQLFRRHWPLLVFTVFGFQVIWSYLSVDLFDAYRMIWLTPVKAFFIGILDSAVFLLYVLVLFGIYQKSMPVPTAQEGEV